MKVGDYVRTDYFGIWQLGSIRTQAKKYTHHLIKYYNDIIVYRDVEEKRIVKNSNSIIDLIEVGDYVNGSKVEEIEEYNGEKYLYLEAMEYSNANQDYINVYCKQEYIKSIVTKEQFENMEYRIGE